MSKKFDENKWRILAMNKPDELQFQYGEKITAERDEWKNKFTDALACNGRLVEQVKQLTAERDELYNWIIEILELTRTGLPLSFMTEEQWASHRLNRIAHIASQAKQETK